jgi:hypothetical protein
MEAYSQLIILWTILKNWWWLPLPFVFYNHFLFFWRWYQTENFLSGVNQVVFEIRIPKEVVKPIKAMEQVFNGFHGVHDVFTWGESWLEGEIQLGYSLEIVSIEGEIHFFIRCSDKFREILESNIYSQYPDAEISIVDDYTKLLPPKTPNKDWDLFGFDFEATKHSAYPIKTYKYFEDGRETIEEKRLDPLAGLLDGMATLGPGEHMWLQIRITPIRDEDPWQKEGEEEIDRLVHRDVKKETKFTPMVKEAADVLISGKPPGGVEVKEEEEFFLPPEMKLTPGEREAVAAIEEKIGKFGFNTTIRCLYLGKKDVFFKPKARIPYGFFKNVSSESMNGLKPYKHTIPKVQWFLKERRQYMRKRRIFDRYVRRMSPQFPLDPKAATFVFTADELATIFHFPGKSSAPAPTIPRVEAKKREAPPELPSE